MTAPTCAYCPAEAVTTVNTGTLITDAGPVAQRKPSCWACALDWARERDWSQRQ